MAATPVCATACRRPFIMMDRQPVVDHSKYICCFCCQESVPQQAVTIHHPGLGLIFGTREVQCG